MKNARCKKIAALLLSCLMLFSLVLPAAAASPQVAFDGEGFRFTPADKDLFVSFKDMMPGDRTEQMIKLMNNSNKKTTFSMQMKIANQEKLSAENLELVEELLFNTDLLNITITANGKEIYSEGAGGTQRKKITEVGAYTTALIELGALSGGHYTNLNVICTVSKELDNRFADIVANVDWEFKAVQPDDTTEPSSGSDITESTTEKDNTLPELPSTGSRSIAGIAVVTSVSVVGVILLTKRKGNKDDEK